MPESQFSPKVLTCSAYEKKGIAEVWQMVEEYIAFTKNNEYFDYKRQRQSKYWMYESINEQLRNHFYQNEKIEQLLKDYETLLLNDKISSFMAAKKLLDIYFEKE